MESTKFLPLYKIAIFGLGLIGGSLAIDLKRLRLVNYLIGYEISKKNFEIAKSRNLVDILKSTPDENLLDTNLIIFALPFNAIEKVLEQIRPYIKTNTIVTDTGSVKSSIMNLMQIKKNKGINFIGGHPIAGSEKFGPESARSNLFRGKQFIVTPSKRTNEKNLNLVKILWQKLGCKVIQMNAKSHDEIFASVSHLPHFIAFASILAIIDSENPKSLGNSGAGLRDFSRIASSNPKLWSDIFIQNKEKLNVRIDILSKKIEELRRYINENDVKKLVKILNLAKTSRDEWMI